MAKKREATYTRIIRNGSHSEHEPPASIDELLALLETQPVASWTTCRPLKKTPASTFLCGELSNRQHPFSILTTDPVLMQRLTQAFLINCDRFHVESDDIRTKRSRASSKASRRKR